MMWHRTIRYLVGAAHGCLAVGLMLSAVGCRQPFRACPVPSAMTAHCSPNFAETPVRRVLLLPVDNQSSFPPAGEQFGMLLANELHSARLFELVQLDPADPALRSGEGHVRDGRFSESLVVKLRADYHVDGVLFATLADVHPYWPPRFAASLHLVSTQTGEVMASVDGAWDAQEEHISHQARQFFQQLSLRESLSDDDLILQSPELMGKFVAHQLVAALGSCAATNRPEEQPAAEAAPSTADELPAAEVLAPVVSTPQASPETLPPPTPF